MPAVAVAGERFAGRVPLSLAERRNRHAELADQIGDFPVAGGLPASSEHERCLHERWRPDSHRLRLENLIDEREVARF